MTTKNTFLVLYASTDNLSARTYSRLMAEMPLSFAAENAKYQRSEDRINRLCARALVMRGMKMLGVLPEDGLPSFSRDKNNRPYIAGSVCDFSISHCDGLAAAALSLTSRAGIDAENLNRRVNAEELISAFAPDEAAAISSSAEPSHELLRLWTRKEAVLKAYGTGLLFDPSKLSAMGGEPYVREKKFYVSRVNAANGYTVHAASSLPMDEVKIIRAEF